MRRTRSLPRELAGRAFSVREARVHGVSAQRLRHPGIASGITGARIPEAVEPTVDARARAALTVMPAGVVSHVTAARLWDLPLPPWLQDGDTVHVTHASGRRTSAANRSGVTGHLAALPPSDIVVHHGVVLTSPSRTFLDLAPSLPIDDLVVLGDAIVCCHDDPFDGVPGIPLTSLSALQRRVSGVRRHRGIVRARTATELIRIGADSPPETRLRLMLVRAGLPEPELNVLVPVDARRRVVQPDLAYRREKVSVQYDGGHHADPRQYVRDIERADLTRAAGWVEVRISSSDMAAMTAVSRWGPVPRAVAKVMTALRARGWAGA